MRAFGDVSPASVSPLFIDLERKLFVGAGWFLVRFLFVFGCCFVYGCGFVSQLPFYSFALQWVLQQVVLLVY